MHSCCDPHVKFRVQEEKVKFHNLLYFLMAVLQLFFLSFFKLQRSLTKRCLVLPGLALAAVYILEENTAGATGGRSPVDLDVGASPRGALHHCMWTVGHKLGFLLIDDLQRTHSHTQVRE